MNLQKILEVILQFAVVLLALSVHESAHAWMADKFGDSTARRQGRVSLNPLNHIDPIGTVVFPLLLALIGAPVFGWAKPVPVNVYNLRNPKRDHMFVAAAGPGSNILMALLASGMLLLLKHFGLVNSTFLLLFFLYLIVINIYLAIFNLIPVPPLDGSGILEGLLKGQAYYQYQKIKPYGFIILLLIIYAGVLDVVARPVVQFVLRMLY